MDGHCREKAFRFEQQEPGTNRLPMAARRALEECGVCLLEDEWERMPDEGRAALIDAGALDQVDAGLVREALQSVRCDASDLEPRPSLNPDQPPPEIVQVLGPDRPLPPGLWAALHPLERYALAACELSAGPCELTDAYDEIVGARSISSHLDASGQVHMVDVGDKMVTHRRAVASAVVRMSQATLQSLAKAPKGDVVAVARVAGVMAAKKAHELVPLCHPIATTNVTIDVESLENPYGLRITARVEAMDRTGVEMEAMVGASVAALTVYDMLKGVERGIVIGQVRLEMKEGGRSGRWMRQAP